MDFDVIDQNLSQRVGDFAGGVGDSGFGGAVRVGHRRDRQVDARLCSLYRRFARMHGDAFGLLSSFALDRNVLAAGFLDDADSVAMMEAVQNWYPTWFAMMRDVNSFAFACAKTPFAAHVADEIAPLMRETFRARGTQVSALAKQRAFGWLRAVGFRFRSREVAVDFGKIVLGEHALELFACEARDTLVFLVGQRLNEEETREAGMWAEIFYDSAASELFADSAFAATRVVDVDNARRKIGALVKFFG